MSTHASPAAGFHVSPAELRTEQQRFYHGVNLALFMAAVTGIELVIIFLPFAEWIIWLGVVLLSVVKFVGVVMWFMHLIYDKALLTILFLSGLSIGTGTVAALLLLFSPKDALPLDDLGTLPAPPAIERQVA